MATAYNSTDEDSNGSEFDVSECDSDQYSNDSDASNQGTGTKPCKYYNEGYCKNGKACSYLHICKYFVKGNCRYGSRCRLNHSGGCRASFVKSRPQNQPKSSPKLTDGRCYQWQLNGGNGWRDIENDQILEAQYSLPHTKSIKIYNTPYGAVSIDFKRITVYGKNVRVRRLDDGNTVWDWYCILGRKWVKYGEKTSASNPCPVKSADIEKKFQSDPSSSFSFDIGGQTLEIRFRDMCQVGQRRKRKVTRRPLFRQNQRRFGLAGLSFPRLNLGSKPQWQFEGDGGRWHIFKSRAGESISSDDIERKYQKNPKDHVKFKMQGQDYKLDLGAKIQTNLTTMNTRRIQRVLDREEEEDYYFGTGGSRKCFEWQLCVGNRWLRIDNDHVIETHYCQPAAKGITINTTVGKVFIDFDTLETSNKDLRVQRLNALPPDQAEDMCWYFRDDHLWCEYGSKGPGTAINSKDIERHFTLYPQGNLRFSVGSNGYSIDFSTMTQTNFITGLQTKIRRRPKYSNTAIFCFPSVLPAGCTSLPDRGSKWEFMDEYGSWTEYQKHSSLSSEDIEVQYQQNPFGQMTFTTKKFMYELDFGAMTQRNLSTNTVRSVRRLT